MHLHELQRDAWRIAETQGHHENLSRLPLREATIIRLALAHTEVSEAIQEVKRHGATSATLPAVAHEVVDAIIRLVELVEDCNYRLGLAINLDDIAKAVMAKNATRPYKYGTPDEEDTHACLKP